MAVRYLYLPAFEQCIPHVIPQDGHLTVVLQQHAALEVQEQAAVIHVDAAHHSGAVVAHPALGVQEAGGELVNAYTRPQKRQIVRPAQPEYQLLVRDARQHQTDIHPALGSIFQRIQHFLADRKVGCIDVDILFCLRKDIQINGFCHRLLVQRTVCIGLHHAVRHQRHQRHQRHGAKRIIIRLAGAKGIPEVEEHHRKVPRGVAFHTQGCILPVAEALLCVDILICQIHTAGVGHRTVNDYDLAVVAVVHHQRDQGHHRVERDAADVRPLHPHDKIGRQAQQTAKIIVDQTHIHALCRLAAQDLLDAIPHTAMAYDEKFQKDALLSLFQIGQQLRIHCFTAGKILRTGVLPCRIGAILCHITALALPAGIQTVQYARLLLQVLFMCAVHSMHFQAQALARAFVAKGQIQCTAQQRQDADQCDPAHLIGAVLVLAHKVQDNEQAQGVEQTVHPYTACTGGNGIEHPAQPQQLQRYQHHRDGDAVQDAVEKAHDRRTKKHQPALLLYYNMCKYSAVLQLFQDLRCFLMRPAKSRPEKSADFSGRQTKK